MHHFLTPGPVATLPLRMGQAAPEAVLVTLPGAAPSVLSRHRGTFLAVTIAPIAARTNHHLIATAGAVKQAGRFGHRQLLPMSTGGSPTSGRYYSPAPATPGARGAALVQDLPGRCQCRTTLNGTDPVDQSLSRVTPRRTRGFPLPASPQRLLSATQRRYQVRRPQRRSPALSANYARVFIAAHTERKPPPDTQPTLDQIVLMVAGLGGLLNRRSDGFPGFQTLWIGLHRAADSVLAMEAQRGVGEGTYG
jgi:hypothetical protein